MSFFASTILPLMRLAADEAQKPSSHDDSGLRPAARAASRMLRPLRYGTLWALPSKWMVISLGITSPSAGGSIGTASLPEAPQPPRRPLSPGSPPPHTAHSTQVIP